jgi:large subunit ribosomal protein L4
MSTVAAQAASSGPGALHKKRVRELATRTVERRAPDGTVLGTVDLDSEWFGHEPNGPLMHQVVVAQLAAARAGTQSTRTRAEVAGGGAKPFRQKGMGRSRQGSIRAPQWVGGGVALGPKPRSYKQHTPKKMIRQALRSALSDRAALARVALVDHWDFELPKTKEAVATLRSLGIEGRVLVVLDRDDVVAERSFGNLQRVQTLPIEELNTYDVLRNDWILFTDESLPGGVGDVSSHEPHPERIAVSAGAPTPDSTSATEDSRAARAAEDAEAAADSEDAEASAEAVTESAAEIEASATDAQDARDEVTEPADESDEPTEESGTEASET